jgi:hypothetical protein
MKTFKNFVKDKENKVPAVLIMQGGHSRRPKDDKVPAQLIKQGEHSKPPKGVKEEWDTKKGEWTGPHAAELASGHHTAGVNHYHQLDDNANKHIGGDVGEVQSELETRHDMNHLSDAEKNRVHEYSDSSWHLNRELYNAHKEGRRHDPERDQSISHIDSALKRHKLPYPLKTFSGTHFDVGAEASKTPSREIHLPAYTSTSIKPSVARGFAQDQKATNPSTGRRIQHMIRFHLPKGHHGLYLGTRSNFTNEHEFLLPRNTRIKVGEHPEIHPHPYDRNTEIHVWDAHPVDHHSEGGKQLRFDFNK